MTRTGTIVTWGIIVILVIVGVIWYANYKSGSGYYATSTVATTTTQYGGGRVSAVMGAPIVITKDNASPSLTAAIVSGTVNPNGLPTSYWIEFGTSAGLGSHSDSQAIGSGYMTIAAYGFLTGLQKSTTYYYRLVAQNNLGITYGNIFTFETASSANPVSKKPTVKTVAATNIKISGATLNGQVNPEGATTYYWFEYGTSTDLGSTTNLVQDGSGTANVSVSTSISGLSSSTAYYFRFNAYNEFGTVLGSILSFKTASSSASAGVNVNANVNAGTSY